MTDSFQRCAIVQILRHPHVIVEWNVFWHVAEMGAGLKGLLENIEPSDRRAARSRRHEAGENPHGRRFACSVWSEESHDFPLADLEIKIADRGLPGVLFCQVFDFDHRNSSMRQLRQRGVVEKFQRAVNETVWNWRGPSLRAIPTTKSTCEPLCALESQSSSAFTEFTLCRPTR